MRRAELEEALERLEIANEAIGEVLDDPQLSAKTKVRRIADIVAGDAVEEDDPSADG